MSDVFDTYVRNADEFYTRLYNDEEYRKEILETTKNLLPSYGELKKYYSEVTLEQFWEDLKGVFGRPPSSNEGSLVYNVKINSKKHNVEVIDTNKVKKDEIEKSIIEEIVKHDEIKTITLNSQTYNIQQLSNLELRNAIDYIPKVYYLRAGFFCFVWIDFWNWVCHSKYYRVFVHSLNHVFSKYARS